MSRIICENNDRHFDFVVTFLFLKLCHENPYGDAPYILGMPDVGCRVRLAVSPCHSDDKISVY